MRMATGAKVSDKDVAGLNKYKKSLEILTSNN